MKNKFTLLSAVIATIMFGSANAATVNGGKITFNGEVTSGACAVSSADSDKLVALDTVKASSFNAADQVANAKKPFTITLLDCETDTLDTVQISFNGQTVDGKPNLLANTAGVGSASNVALQLYNPDGSELNVGTLSSTVDLVDTTIIPLSVDYVSTAAVVTAGKVQSSANFMLTYN